VYGKLRRSRRLDAF
jgi:hypothetical protein